MRRIEAREERGQSIVEFAIVLPVLAFVLFAILQFGITLNNYVTLTSAARDGARKGAVSRTVADPIGTTVQAVKASAVDLNQSGCTSTACTTNCTTTSLCVTVTPSSVSGWTPGADVTVNATYPYSISLFGLVVKSGTLSSTVTERIE
jgi:Flp pilus assembly protein TadG